MHVLFTDILIHSKVLEHLLGGPSTMLSHGAGGVSEWLCPVATLPHVDRVEGTLR